MRCRTCGCEVDDDKAFCPSCGATMKVTADYDYIQAEIANKVDRVFNEEENTDENNQKVDLDIPDLDQIISSDDNTETEETENAESEYEEEIDEPAEEAQDEEEIEQPEKKHRNKSKKAEKKRKRRSEEAEDSIFDREVDEESDDNEDSYDDIDEEYDEDVEEKPAKQPKRGNKSRDGRPSNKRQSRKQSARRERPRNVRESYSYDDEPGNQTSGKVFTILIIFVIIAATAIGVMYILGVFDGKTSQSGTSQVSETTSLTANVVNGNTYTAPYEVSISDALGGVVYYTLDGSEPTESSKAYTGAFSLSASDVQATYPNVTLRAAAFDKNGEKTGEISISFMLEGGTDTAAAGTDTVAEGAVTTAVAAPQVTPESGTYEEDADIEVTAEDGAKIYYTLDGSEPTEESIEYVGTIKMPPETSTFKAIAVKDGVTSDVTTCEYTLNVYYDVSPQQALINVLMATDEILDNDMNTADGYAQMQNIGIYEIDGYQYYIVRVDFYSTDGALTSSQYDAVGVNYGGVSGATASGNTFTVNE